MSSWYLFGQHVSMLNRACVEQLRGLHQWNEKLLEAKNLLFEIRYEMDDQNGEHSTEPCIELCSKFCIAHDLFKTVVGKSIV